MTARWLKRAWTLVAVAFVIVILLPMLVGRPTISYAKSGSMEPTIGTFDVFFVDPFPRHIRGGDIIVYWSDVRGENVVHRIVGGDENGWFTQGDANTVMDQMGAEPIVSPDRIRGRVVTSADGAPHLIPDLGASIVQARLEYDQVEQRVGGSRMMLALLFAGIGIVAALSARKTARPHASRTHRGALRWEHMGRRMMPRGLLGKHIALTFAVLICIGAFAAAARADTHVPTTIIVVKEASAADGMRAGAPGDVLERDIRVGSLGWLPTVVVLESGSNGVRIDEAERLRSLPAWTTERAIAHQTAHTETGVQQDTVVVWRYPHLMPESAIVALHEFQPGAPYAAIAATTLAGAALWLRVIGIWNAPVGRWLGFREAWT